MAIVKTPISSSAKPICKQLRHKNIRHIKPLKCTLPSNLGLFLEWIIFIGGLICTDASSTSYTYASFAFKFNTLLDYKCEITSKSEKSLISSF